MSVIPHGYLSQAVAYDGHDGNGAFTVVRASGVCAHRYLSCGQVVTPLEASQLEDLMPPPFRRILDWARGGCGA